MNQMRPLLIGVLVLKYLPFVALAVLGTVILGWRFGLALAMLVCLLPVYLRRAVRPVPQVSRRKATLEFVAFSLAGSVIGGVAFGPLGVMFGFVLGFTAGLAEVPITRLK